MNVLGKWACAPVPIISEPVLELAILGRWSIRLGCHAFTNSYARADWRATVPWTALSR